ncbi:MAG: N-acetylmuramoyl-L-alanine amidase [Propionibacteriaceae bacterium]|nr:N-acetylmuramoyl-L-alanine amidase [Propionibacteriaceae bacterium]
MSRVYLSPSNQTANPYSAGNTTEAAQARRIAAACAGALTAAGVDVMVAGEATSINTGARMREANQWGADVYVPIHTDAGGGHGCTVFCYPGRETNPVVQGVYNAVSTLTPTADRGIRANASLMEINRTSMLCVYVEAAFHDNPSDAQWIIDHVDAIGQAIAQGIIAGQNGTSAPAPTKPVPGPVAPEPPKVDPALTDGIVGPATVRHYQTGHNLTVDGIGGQNTMAAILAAAGVKGDGWIDLDNATQVHIARKWFPAFTIVRVGNSAGPGSGWWRSVQALLGTTQDGQPGPNDARALQTAIREGKL